MVLLFSGHSVNQKIAASSKTKPRKVTVCVAFVSLCVWNLCVCVCGAGSVVRGSIGLYCSDFQVIFKVIPSAYIYCGGGDNYSGI